MMRHWRHISELLGDYLGSIERSPSDGQVPKLAVRTGFADLDQLLLGLRGGELTVIASRPSTGKTSLALNIARNAAFEDATVAFFSIELPTQQLFERLISAESGVGGARLSQEQLSQREMAKISAALNSLSECRLFSCDATDLTIGDLGSSARSLQVEHGLDLIVVDWLQLITAGVRTDSRAEELGHVSRGLKQLSRQLDVPIIACAQLSFASWKRPGIPALSDLADSGSIEDEADVVIFLYREDMNINREQWEKDQGSYGLHREYPAGITQLIVAKHRNGPKGTIHLRFHEKIGRFDDLIVRNDDWDGE